MPAQKGAICRGDIYTENKTTGHEKFSIPALGNKVKVLAATESLAESGSSHRPAVLGEHVRKRSWGLG